MTEVRVWLKNSDLLSEQGLTIVQKHMVWARELCILWNIRRRLVKEIKSKKTTPSLRCRSVVLTYQARRYYYRSLLFNHKSVSAANDWFTCYRYGLAECLESELSLQDNMIFESTDVYLKSPFTLEHGFVSFPLGEGEYRLSEGSDVWTDDDTDVFRDYNLRVIKFMDECEKYFSEEFETPFSCRRWIAKVKRIHKTLYGDQ